MNFCLGQTSRLIFNGISNKIISEGDLWKIKRRKNTEKYKKGKTKDVFMVIVWFSKIKMSLPIKNKNK